MRKWTTTPVIHCGDNLDIRSWARFEGGSASYHDIHLYNDMIFKSRIPIDNLSDVYPAVNLCDISFDQFRLNEEEEQSLSQLMKSLIKETRQSHRSNSVSATYPPNKYSSQMKLKSEKV